MHQQPLLAALLAATWTLRSMYPENAMATVLLDMPGTWIAMFIYGAFLLEMQARSPPDWGVNMMGSFVIEEDAKYCFQLACRCLALVDLLACLGVIAARIALARQVNEFARNSKLLSTQQRLDVSKKAALYFYASGAVAFISVSVATVVMSCSTGAPFLPLYVLAMTSWFPCIWAALIGYGIIMISARVTRAGAATLIEHLDNVHDQLQQTQTCGDDTWPDLTEQLCQLHDGHSKLWCGASLLLSLIYLPVVLVVAMMGFLAYVAMKAGNTSVSCQILVAVFIHLALLLGTALPMADIASFCDQIRASALRSALLPIPANILSQLQMFLYVLDQTTLGVMVPFIGQISMATLSTNAKLLAGAAPMVISFFVVVLKKKMKTEF